MTSDFLLWWRQPPRNDASTIMGMQTPVAAALAIGIWVASVILGIAAGGVLNPLLYIASMVVMFAALVVLLSAPRDPLAGWATACIVLAPPVATVMAVPGLTNRPGMAYGTLTGVSVIILAFLAVRGRPVAAWIGYGLCLGVALLADHFAGPLPALVAAQAPNLAVVLMATIFAAIVRPRARQIYAFRGETERETALRYAEEATLAVRDQQLSRLDDGARPLLDRIASGSPLSADELRLCRLVEAQLRDRIRAPGFDSPAVAGAAWRARARGARVVVLDDLGIGSRTAKASLDAVSADLIAVLDAAAEGDEVTARLLPAGRNSFATVSITNRDGFERREFDDIGLRQDLDKSY
ncbi:hypothetical protein [Gordonia sp. (in: high G+C Gram-positive bacteria)]|uniref:hypothetical protein n=1 Tax=Gordonia sp. (in: high G+C Gram-positive bacteria) TaxID=84139 RepID=UPI00168F6D5C|nr:hypothetical protein [Gordonia sp. (in: high G+C Gram-positive bacteria)]NLG48298.1 hypothetical protein [Gordonia sp. (in: high G+C Gram-positive bacteria)]